MFSINKKNVLSCYSPESGKQNSKHPIIPEIRVDRGICKIYKPAKPYPMRIISVRIKKTVLILPVTCRHKSVNAIGRSSDLFHLPSLPSGQTASGKEFGKFISIRDGIHSNRYCPGFSPDSLFSRRTVTPTWEPFAPQR